MLWSGGPTMPDAATHPYRQPFHPICRWLLRAQHISTMSASRSLQGSFPYTQELAVELRPLVLVNGIVMASRVQELMSGMGS